MANPVNLQYLYSLINHSALSPVEKASFFSFCHEVSPPSSPNSAIHQLSIIPSTCEPSSIPLACLSFLLTNAPRRFPVFYLIRYFTKIWRGLPEVAKSGHDLSTSHLAATTLALVKSSYRDLTELIPSESSKAAIQESQSQKYLSHRTLSAFVRNFGLPIRQHGREKPIVVIALPNGPLLGLACIAVTAYYTAAPINSSSGAEQFRSDVLQAQSKTILVLKTDVKKLGLEDSWVAEADIQVLFVEAKSDLTFSITPVSEATRNIQTPKTVANGPDDLALILFTSGTSGTKKVVPLSIHNIVCGVAFVIESWGLGEADVCLNMMPLNHVGGLIRNLFAPILAGGSTICCPAFDPNLFWDVVEEQNPTWYYASPSMHLAILAEIEDRREAHLKSQIRLVCNAAGGLLPSLALQLHEIFGCVVLPSYGMTECMPISTPPLNYALDRPGTSGVSVGPEIAILDSGGLRLPINEIGRIGVRGPPVFPGYLRTGQVDPSVFTSDGWFDTGDMGYLDEDGYLYLTGRSKEVVNRGGEIISPFEVEEAIMVASRSPESSIFNRVAEALVFSAPHNVLQEVVGVVIVTPNNMPRPDLRQLHDALKLSLHQPKWPFVIVYMDAAPKNNNKLLRIRLGERLGFEPLSDDMKLAERHFEAKCPPPDTALTQKIEMSLCQISLQKLARAIEQQLTPTVQVHVSKSAHDGLPEVVLSTFKQTPRFSDSHERSYLIRKDLYSSLDGYLIPNSVNYIDEPLPMTHLGQVDEVELQKIIRDRNFSSSDDYGSTEYKIRNIYATLLACSINDITFKSDFFEMGGDSMKAGRLLSILRKELNVRVPISSLFQNSKVKDLCDIVNEHLSCATAEKRHDHGDLPLPGCAETHSSTNPFVMLIQILPIGLLYPMKRALKWTIFLYILSYSIIIWPLRTTLVQRFINLLLAMTLSKVATQICSPIIAIAIKWIVVGKYKEGMYPMWGPYHMRWWFVQKALSVGGPGFFGYTDYTTLLYYRLLGAKIGKGVSIAKTATLGEYDLLDIGDNVELDACLCRPFAVEHNTSMYLRRIVLGNNSSIGRKAVVAPGTVLPDGTCIGPNSSTWEVKDATEANRDLTAKRIPKPHPALSLLSLPVQWIVRFATLLPWMGGLLGVILEEPVVELDPVRSVTIWFADGKRVGFHFLARVLSVLFGPFVFFFMVVLVKVLLDKSVGKIEPGPADNRSQLQKFRMSLMSSLIPKGDLSKITDLFGTHYEFTSIAVRALGGKVGKRVYWPGNGPSMQDFELLSIGDNVVFGSRSHILTSDGLGSQKVEIGDNAMVADRVIILPGTTLGKNTVLGSGAVTRRDTSYPAGTVWVGCKQGSAVCLTSEDQSTSFGGSTTLRSSAASIRSNDSKLTAYSRQSTLSSQSTIHKYLIGTGTTTSLAPSQDLEKTMPTFMLAGRQMPIEELIPEPLRPVPSKQKTKNAADPNSSPFGKAFYEGKANYYVFGYPIILLYSNLTNVFCTIYWNIAPLASIQVLARAMQAHPHTLGPVTLRPLSIYFLVLAVMIPIMAAQAVLALALVAAAKWSLMGRRQPGKYDWDTSSYCQRWQVLLTIERIRRHCYGGNGVIGLLTGSYFAVLYFRALGATIGKDCALWAGGHASLLFTEPDLLTLGDRVAVDDASLVAHINSRGNFSLNSLSVGDRSVLRSGSRLLSGASMGQDSCLLEHTLIMAGDVAEEGATYQGWPADEFVGDRGKPDCGTGVSKADKGLASFEALTKECPA